MSFGRPIVRDVVRDATRSPMDRRGGGTDADAAAWAAAVTGAGGTYSGTTLAAVSTFVKSAKASGYWTKLNRINLFCGNQLAACLVPLKVGGGSATETNVNFVGGDYTEATGLTGNGTTKYLDTGLIPSVSLAANDTHLAVYDRAAAAAGGERSLGSQDASGVHQIWAINSDGVFYSDQYNGVAGRVQSGVLSFPFGMLIASRTAAASHTVYRAGTSLANNATSGGAFPAVSMLVFKSRDGTGAPNAAGTNHPLAGYSIGSGLTAGDVAAFATHMQTFQTAMGRQV